MPERRGFAALLIAPALLLFGAFLVVPLVHLFIVSVHAYSPATGVASRWTLGNYARFAVDPFYLAVLARTIWDAALTTLICIVLGYPLALYLAATSGAARAYLTLLLLSPLLVSMVIRAYGWVIILGSHGPLVALLAFAHLNAPPLLFTDAAVVIGLVHVSLAYMVLPIVGSLERIDPAVLCAAANLGADEWTTFRRVTVPLTLPGLAAGSIIVFSLAASAFVTPSILGGTRVKLLSSLIYDQIVSLLNWPFGSAIGFVLILVSTGLLVVFSRLLTGARGGITVR